MSTSIVRYGVLGPKGTFTEEIAQRLFPHAGYEGVLYPSNGSVLEAVAAGELSMGVVPIENSLEGTVNEVVDTILQLENLWITGEVTQPIQHHLIGMREIPLSGIRRILSHPQAYGQCQKWIRTNVPTATFEAVASTATAVSAIGFGAYDETCAAIGNRRAASVNERTEILAESIQDSQDNTTRFVTVGRSERPRTSMPCKTSIVFSTERDVPGSLVDALIVFKAHCINMTKIESRPKKQTIGDYLFLVDFMGHHEDEPFALALAQLRARWVTQFRLLGSYPRLLL